FALGSARNHCRYTWRARGLDGGAGAPHQERRMRSRGPANYRADPYTSRTSGSLARSPAERLEPTRPPARPRRRRMEGDVRRTSPALRIVSGIFTFILLLMLLAGGVA